MGQPIKLRLHFCDGVTIKEISAMGAAKDYLGQQDRKNIWFTCQFSTEACNMRDVANPMANQVTAFVFACSIQTPCVKFDLHFQFGVSTVKTAILVDVDVNVVRRRLGAMIFR